ncbi:MAG TPA: zf-HC2 domain-containing protein [Vicinamibacterales bacterium]|nr:zf-HC2 domain-containing protein [Vicinamibacterales bacterium]
MQCADVREFADSFLSGELQTETIHQMLRHLETCPWCRAEIAARRALRAQLKGAFDRDQDLQVEPAFLAAMRARLHAGAARPAVPRTSRFGGWRSLAAAALIVATLSGALRWRSWSASVELAAAAVGDHRNCAVHFRLAERPITLEDAALRYDPSFRAFAHEPPAEIPTTVGPARVLERHVCLYAGHRFAHIVFEYRGRRVSLVATPVGRSLGQLLSWRTASPVATRADDLAVVSLRAGRHAVFFAGDVSDAEMKALANAVAGPLSRALSGT